MQKKGIQIIRSIEREIIKTRALAILGHEYKKNGQVEQASELFEETIKIVEDIEDEYKRGLAISSLANQFSILKEKDITQKLNNRAIKISKIIDERRKQINILQNVAWSYIKLDEYERALEICMTLKDKPVYQIILILILEDHLSEHGKELNWKERRMIKKIVVNNEGENK